uniref:CRIB domain-containing protein n=1 Tax=Panagrolaimus sp. ES5 TaxID=591445 RepID=A0AC34F1J7_9BILA
MEQPTLPKLTAKILESEIGESKYSPKQRSRKPVKKKDIGWPTDFRHSSHIGFMDNNSVDGIVPIEVDGKLVYVDSNTMEKIQDANLSSPVLEGKEWAIDAPVSVSPQRRPRPKRIPLLEDTSKKVFSQPVSSTDSPSSPVLYENIPFSTKKMPAPPPPTTKKPALKPLPLEASEMEEKIEISSIKSENSEKIVQIEEKINELSEELEKLRKEKAKFMAEVKIKEEEKQQKVMKEEIEYEPFIQAHVIDRLSSSVSNDVSPSIEVKEIIHSEPDDEVPHSPEWEDGLPEAIRKLSKPKKEPEPAKIHSLSKEHELEKEDIIKMKQFTESILTTEKVEAVKLAEVQPFKPVPPPRKKPQPPPSSEKPLRKSQDLESPTGSEVCRL